MLRYACATLLTVVATVAIAPPAAAKDKPEEPPAPVKRVCNLLVDPIGDTPLPSRHLDIRSGDVATTTSTVLAAVRVADLQSDDSIASLGSRWDFGFAVGSTLYEFTARRDASGNVTATFSRDFGGTPIAVGPVTVRIDQLAGEIRWSAPRKAVRELGATTGTQTIYALSADTYAGPHDTPMDTAKSSARYLDGTPSCLTP